MNRTIPVASAKTLDPAELYEVICAASSQDPSRIQVATTRLKVLLDTPGALDILHEIAARRDVPLAVRQQSIIQFKNNMNHWKSRRYVNDEQKSRTRERSLTFLDEPDDTVADTLAVSVGKMARIDLPQNQWPSLLPTLATAIHVGIESCYVRGENSSILPLRRSLEFLNVVLKEYVAAKMATWIKIMGQIVDELRVPLQSHYSIVSTPLIGSLNPTTAVLPRTAEDLLIAHLLLKCIIKMARWSYHRVDVHYEPEKWEPWVNEYFQQSLLQLQTLSELRANLALALRPLSANPTARTTVELLHRHVRLYGRFYRHMQTQSATRFVSLPACGDLVLYYWSKVVQAANGPQDYIEDSSDAVFPVTFLVQAMVLFKDSLAQWAPTRKDGAENERVLSKDFVEDAVRLLVTKYIPLKTSDLEEWMSDPEEWVSSEEQDNEQWTYELRACSERVLVTLSYQYHQFVTPMLKTTFEQIAMQHATDLSSVIQKEALYCALGRCAHKLKDMIPFNDWLAHILSVEARGTHESYPILKRRIAWLIGKWVSEEVAPATDPKIWEVLVYLLQDRGAGSDTVVRLTAAIAVRQCVDTIQFDEDVFAPFLSTTVVELVRLISEMETFVSQRQIANALNAVIERAGPRIVPLMALIAEPLPQLWTAADWTLKATLLTTVTKLIESSQEHSNSLTALVVPLVKESFAPAAVLQLDEDGLILWQAAVRNATTVNGVKGGPGLTELLPLLVNLLSTNLDLLGKISSILKSYYLLDAPCVLQLCAVDLFRAYLSAMGSAPRVNVKDMLSDIALLFQIAPAPLWTEALHVSGFFAVGLKTLGDDEEGVPILTEWIHVLARISLADKHNFLRLMSATAAAQNLPEESSLWEGLLNQWWTRFDNMSEPQHRKLSGMGIANLVSTGRPEVLDRLATEICNMWLDVFSEIKEARESAENADSSLSLYWDRPLSSFYPHSIGTPEYDRAKVYYDNDPVRTVQLTVFIASCVREAEAACGGGPALQERYLAKADALVLKQIQKEIFG